MPTQEGGPPIFNGVSSSPLDDTYATGFIPGAGTFYCVGCGNQLSLEESETLPECPRCGEDRYRRDSIFESMRDHSDSTSEFPLPEEPGPPDWLERTRRNLDRGRHLVRRDDDGEVRVFVIERGWTRIGRSSTADLRLDDPSVSRRHALIVAEPGRLLRVLDDRSLNGVFVNGERVEWSTLADGDEVVIGRHHLHFIDVPVISGMRFKPSEDAGARNVSD
jgi:predicted RNA-binding Zn-ribbon protein involved in translation (DUF1610 family)